MKEIVNKKLKKHIEDNIFPLYQLNDGGHNLRHINIVLERAFELSKDHDIDNNMLYAVVCYHDIACHIDREKHEILSAKWLFEDDVLHNFFNEEQMIVMKNAIEDHRASLEYEPRNIYGKIISSADRKTDIVDYYKSSLAFEMKRNPNITDDELINLSYNHAIKKFGKDGYAVSKFYIEDKKYKEFLNEIQRLIENKSEFFEKAKVILKDIEKMKKI